MISDGSEQSFLSCGISTKIEGGPLFCPISFYSQLYFYNFIKELKRQYLI